MIDKEMGLSLLSRHKKKVYTDKIFGHLNFNFIDLVFIGKGVKDIVKYERLMGYNIHQTLISQ